MAASVNNAAAGGGAGGVSLTASQVAAGATGVIASDAAGNAYKQDGTAFSGGATIAHTTAVLKGDNAGNAVAATVGTDYLAPSAIASTTNFLKGDGAGNAIDSGVAGLPSLLAVNTQPFGIAPSASTVGANGGAFTAGTAFIETYGPTGGIPYDGIWLWFPANTVDAATAAGYWWVVMTSTTLGTVFNNFLTPGNAALNKPPATPVAFTTNAGGTSAGTTSQILGWLVTLPANILGANGTFDLEMSLRNNASAGTKSLTPKFGGSNVGTGIAATTTSTVEDGTTRFFNTNNTSRQRAIQKATTSTYVSTQTPGNAAVNTTLSTTIGVDLSHNTATDWVVCQYASIRVWPSA